MGLRKRLEKIKDRITQPTFLENKGLGNEIGFYIFDYDPKDELIVRDHINYLVNALNEEYHPKKVIELDLYEILLMILEREDLLQEIPKTEKEQGTDYILEAIRDLARPEMYVDIIAKESKDYEIVFLTGVGKVWPIVRSHNILNNLHHVLDHVPVIMFFPGTYDGSELRLFKKMKDDNYYRAFQLVK